MTVNVYIKSMVKDREYLIQLLESHRDTIVSRWSKKSRKKREAILLRAMPELFKQRWIHALHCYTEEHNQSGMLRRNPDTRKQLLMHWLNLEVLRNNPSKFLALLHARTLYSPQEWAPFDDRQLGLGWASGQFDIRFSTKCVVMYGESYGYLVDWNAAQAHRVEISGFPRAEIVLEEQANQLRVFAEFHKKSWKVLISRRYRARCGKH